MTNDIQELIQQRPHLKEPLEFYGKWQQFRTKTNDLISSTGYIVSAGSPGVYPNDCIDSILNHFSEIFDLQEELAHLGNVLKSGEINFLSLPLESDTEPTVSEEQNDLSTTLFLLSRPYFETLRKVSDQDGTFWKNGLCPLCSAHPALSTIAEGPQRILHCSYCGTNGPYEFIGCPNCGTKETSKLNTIASDQEPGFRISVCTDCHSYVKVVDNSVLKEMSLDIADIVSIPLDIVAQTDGYTRRSPNPIGLQMMG